MIAIGVGLRQDIAARVFWWRHGMKLNKRYLWAMCVGVLFLVIVPRSSTAELRSIWALDDGTKIKRGALQHRLKQRNVVFDGERVELFALRNETVAFQLILEGGGVRTRDVSVTLQNIGPIVNDRSLDWGDAFYKGRRIVIYRQGYVHVARASHDLAWEPNSPAAPRGLVGWVPDPLIPLSPDQRFDVDPSENQGIWIDVFVPGDVPAGSYTGEVVVSVAGKPCRLSTCRLPVSLEVLPEKLPEVPAAATMLYFAHGPDDADQMLARYVEGDPWSAPQSLRISLRDKHYKLGWRHSIALIDAGRDSPADTQSRFTGSLFTPENGYEGPGEGHGIGVVSLGTYGAQLKPGLLRSWSQWMKKFDGSVEGFRYVIDEPSRSEFPKVQALVQRAKPMKSFVTVAHDPELNIDIFCAIASDYSVEAARKASKRGKVQWIYNGVRPFTGTFVIDDVAISPRVNGWIQYKYKIPRWFYWNATYYRDTQGGRGAVDVFTDPMNFSNDHGDAVNGDGLLVYPGMDTLFPESSHGLEIPIPSIRLKNWRRGVLDVGYLRLARENGFGSQIQAMLDRLIPRALRDEVHPREPVSWSEDGEVWFAARQQLAKLVTHRPSDAPPRITLPSARPDPLRYRVKRWLRKARAWARRRPVLSFVAVLVLLVAAAGVAGSYWIRRRRRR